MKNYHTLPMLAGIAAAFSLMAAAGVSPAYAQNPSFPQGCSLHPGEGPFGGLPPCYPDSRPNPLPPPASGQQRPFLPQVMMAPPSNMDRAEQLAWSCAQLAATGNVDTFARCMHGNEPTAQVILPASQQLLVQCAELSTDISGFAACSGAGVLGKSLSGDQQAALACAIRSNGDANSFAGCIGNKFIGQLTQDERTALDCARQSSGRITAFATCAGTRILGPRLSQDQRSAIECLAQSGGNPSGFATCAGNKVLNSQLNPEQQIAVQCIAQSAGQPYAAAACTATRLTARELQKCVNGIGTENGCYGPRNDLVGRDGWTARTFGNALKDIQRGGCGPTNDLCGAQGKAAEFLQSIRLSAPPPLQVGTVAGHRVCIPWC